MSELIVQKYGGTSVGDLERIQKVAEHIHQTLRADKLVVVVVSAMGTYTDELLESAYSLNASPPKRELDMLVTTGERISMALLSIALAKLAIPSISLTGSQSGILTDENHGNARIHKILGDRIRQGLAERKVVIVAGFQGVSPATKDITSLGRGGSDLTAIALAVSLGAQSCQIYTYVDGVMTADPRMIPKARLIPHLSWQEMLELAWAGAGVLHHRGAYVAAKYKLAVEIRSSLKPTRVGTLIEGNQPMEKAHITALTHKQGQSLLVFASDFSADDAACLGLDYCLSWLWQQEESPAFIQQRLDEDGQPQILTLFNQRFADALLLQIDQYCAGHGKNLRLIRRQDQLAIVSLIGLGFRQSPEIVAAVYQSFTGSRIFYTETRDNQLSFVVDQQHLPALLPRLHSQFLAANSGPKP